MKKALMLFVSLIFLAGIIGFAIAENEDSGSIGPVPTLYSADNNTDNLTNDSTEIVGSSCGTVTPGENNACCISKGYSGWNQEEFKCIGEVEKEREIKGTVGSIRGENRNCEAWKCSQWGACLNGKETRSCSKLSNCTNNEEKPRITKGCSERDKLGLYNRTVDCPENCTCVGSTVKCNFENGTRVMTIYAGNSGNVIVQVKNINMSTNVTLYKSINGTLYAVFTGNRTHEIRLPDDIKDRLENHTGIKFYNESINLTEDGYYVMDMNKKSRLFFIFPVREHMNAQVDAETGAIIKIRNPWWGFLARDIKDKGNSTTA